MSFVQIHMYIREEGKEEQVCHLVQQANTLDCDGQMDGCVDGHTNDGEVISMTMSAISRQHKRFNTNSGKVMTPGNVVR